MAKASDPRLAELTKKRPASAPKPGEILDIPTIILSDRKESTSLLSSSLSSSVHFGMPSSSEVGVTEKGESAGQQGHGSGSHMGVRSSSDIGLPASSMPNLAIRLGPGGDLASTENFLDVFCSPRTFRRSVDLDVNSKDHTRGQFEWVDTMESSTNCLKVLTSSSRVGSALSLNSECTTRSIGLLSNDSDSENDLSLTDSEKVSLKPSQLRRFMSYSEDVVSRDVCARPSQSMSYLKTMDKTQAGAAKGPDAIILVTETVAENIDTADSLIQDRKCEAANRDRVLDDRGGAPCDPRLQEKVIRANKKEIPRDRSRGGTARPSHMLSYKCDIHDSNRDCRIRQWLQDMDSQE
ncbi:unnamed protein product [Candidula unifasciata]|uniref:Uncharacterized protein n=1 Tax=Candidula unifasciata TaxID=100452 RepID=A0A8S4A875_9EUPU|nr:unnamed protein product [Candidula unifasciata]